MFPVCAELVCVLYPLDKILPDRFVSQVVVAHVLNPVTLEAQVGGSLVYLRSGLGKGASSKPAKATQWYCLKKTKNKNTTPSSS